MDCSNHGSGRGSSSAATSRDEFLARLQIALHQESSVKDAVDRVEREMKDRGGNPLANAATTLVIEGPDHYRRVIVPQGVGLVGVYVGVDGVSVTFDGEEVQDADE